MKETIKIKKKKIVSFVSLCSLIKNLWKLYAAWQHLLELMVALEVCSKLTLPIFSSSMSLSNIEMLLHR